MPSDCLVLGSHGDGLHQIVTLEKRGLVLHALHLTPPCTSCSHRDHLSAAGWWFDAGSGLLQQCTLRLNEQSLLEFVPNGLSRTPLRLLLTPHGFGKAHVNELVKVLLHV